MHLVLKRVKFVPTDVRVRRGIIAAVVLVTGLGLRPDRIVRFFRWFSLRSRRSMFGQAFALRGDPTGAWDAHVAD